MRQYSTTLFKELFNDGIISYKVLLYREIYDKFESLPGNTTTRVKLMVRKGMSESTIYRAIRLFRSTL